MNAVKTPDELLDKLPKKTPKWAVGVVTILVAISTSLLAMYIFAKDDVHQVIQWAEAHHDTRVSLEAKDYSDTLGRVLTLLDVNSTQIIELSKTLGVTQHQNQLLSGRVDEMEKRINGLVKDLKICESERDNCLKNIGKGR